MSEAGHDFEALLARRERRARAALWILAAIMWIGALAAASAALAAESRLRAVFGVCALAACAAGLLVARRASRSESGAAIDDLLSRSVPRILGGAKPEKFGATLRRRSVRRRHRRRRS